MRNVLVAESVESAQSLFVAPDSGFVVLSPAFATFDLAELSKRLSAGLNQPIEEKLLAAIAQVIELFFKQAGYPAAGAVIPTQNISNGQIRVIAVIGEKGKAEATKPVTEWKIRNIDSKGGRWFSESLLRRKLQLEQGQLVRFSDLAQSLDWTNNSPFRRVHVHLEPVPNSVNEADATISILDALPLRLNLTVDNAGNEFIGKRRFIAGISYANLWGLDHQVGYQFVTTDQSRFLQVHGIDYRVPLPRRHILQVSANYLEAKPELLGGAFVSKGESINADIRYLIPLRTGENSLEASAALSFKQSNNNLLFGTDSVQATKTDIIQLTTSISGVWRDKRGVWGLGANFTLSPGHLSPRNTTESFDGYSYDIERGNRPVRDSSRIGAKASYAYASFSVQRLLNITPGWDILVRGAAQYTNSRLLPSEQFNIGGANSVRGYRENRFSAENGFAVSSELLVPSWKLVLPRISKSRGPLESRFLLFFDMGDTYEASKRPSDLTHHTALSSAGFGLRSSLSYHFNFSADYGWQLARIQGLERERGVGHIKATLAF
ncbi:MAG: ShlB/FhaC/HecB family hemolysin secretion/activation protein [Opitutaceae bacterium]|nr:ShlB/FhaC/HecB family hemolysin secretion/activation protein [Opitutaceae bacterium]